MVLFGMGRDAGGGRAWLESGCLRTDVGRRLDPALYGEMEEAMAGIAPSAAPAPAPTPPPVPTPPPAQEKVEEMDSVPDTKETLSGKITLPAARKKILMQAKDELQKQFGKD